MRKFPFLLLILPAIAFAPAKSTVSKQLKDFKAFEKVLIKKEGRLDLHQSSDTMHLYLSKLKRQLSEDQKPIEQFKLFSKTLSKLGCGHTQIHPTQELLSDWVDEEQSLPLDFIMQGKRLYTNKLISEDYSIVNMAGTNNKKVRSIKGNYEILTLNNKTVPEMMAEISPYISSDEDGIDFKYHQVAQLFEFYRHLSDPYEVYDLDSVGMTYIKEGDTLLTYFRLSVPPIHSINERLGKAAAEDARIQKETGTFEIKSSSVGLFRFRSFTSCKGKEYDDFLRRSFKKIKSRKLKKLIIDLRGNTGGVMQYSLMSYFVGKDVNLGRYVIEKPKKFFETTHLKKRGKDYRSHKWSSRIQRFEQLVNTYNNGDVISRDVDADLIFDGDIVVITDEATFSSASILACHLKTLCDAKLVGRPAGGSFYRGNAGTLIAVLPNSKFKLLVNPNTFYSQLERSADPYKIKQTDVLLEPGYIVPRKLDNYYIEAAIDSFQ